MQEELVRAGQILRLLRHTKITIRNWRADRFLMPVDDDKHSQPYYLCGQVNAILAKGAVNFPATPTVADLVEGRLRLLTASEFRALGCKRPSTPVKQGHVAAIKIRNRLLYSEESAKLWLCKERKFTTAQTLQILDIGKDTLTRLIRDGVLQKVKPREGSRQWFITASSLITLLKELLPPWLAPDDWIEDRLASNHPLLFIRTLQLTDKSHSEVLELLLNEKIQYIRRPVSKIPMISPESHLVFIQSKEPVVGNKEFAKLFGVTATSILNWDKLFPGWRTCHLHPHNDSTLYKTCAVKILQSYLSGGSPHAWYVARLVKGVPLIDQTTAMKVSGIATDTTFKRAIKDYNLTHIRSPSGQLRFSRMSVLRMATKRRAARSK